MNPQSNLRPPRYGRALRLSVAEVLFYGIILSLPFEEWFGPGGSVSVPKLIGLAFLPCSLLQWRTFYGAVPRALVVLLGWVGIGFVVDLARCGGLTVADFNEFCRPLLLWVLLLASYNLARHGRLERIMNVVFAASLLLACFQVLELGVNESVQETVVEGQFGRRVAVLGANANGLAVFLALGVVCGLARAMSFVRTRLGYRVLFALAAGFGFLGILRTGSRGGLLALGLSLLSLVLATKNLGRAAASGLAVAGLLAAMGAAVMQDPYLMARFKQKGDQTEVIGQVGFLGNINTAGRFAIWEGAARCIARSPFYGYGATLQGPELAHELALPGKTRATHNTWLSLLLGTGVGGFLCFFYFQVRACQSAWSGRTRGAGGIVFAWWVLLMLVGSTSGSIEGMKLFWVVMALALAAKKVYARPRARQPAPAFGGGQTSP